MSLNHLDFNSRTRKRAEWEAFEFELAGPYQIRVINASYGNDKHEHAYVVGIEARDGVLLPAECECPADIHHDTACKHRVAIAIRGGSLLMQAATVYDPTDGADSGENPPTLASRLRADGGTVAAEEQPDPDHRPEDPKPCWCTRSDFPCWPCYRDGLRDLPE